MKKELPELEVEPPPEEKGSMGYGVCAFIDALGTTEMLDELASQTEESYEMTAKLQAKQHQHMEAIVEILRTENPKMPHLSVQTFSDSTFIVCIGDSDKSEFGPALAIIAAGRAAFRVGLYFNVLRIARGGIATGYLYTTKGFVVGSPVSHAVGIESKLAKDPCIALSRAAENFIRNFVYTDLETLSETQSQIREKILKRRMFIYTESGKLILNPYFALLPISEDESLNDDQHSIVKNAYYTIRIGLEQNELRPDIYAKYAFARDLHNANMVRNFQASEFVFPVSAAETAQRFYSVETYLKANRERITPGTLV